MKGLYLFVALLFMCNPVLQAQTVTYSSDSTKTLIKPVITYAKPAVLKASKPIKHEFSMGFRLNTDGWGIFADYGKVKARDLKRSDMFHDIMFLQLEFGETKNAKEQKIRGATNKYIYGKVNNLYALKAGVGFQKMIAGKPDPGSVSIHWVNTVSFSLGLLKPYYLNVYSSVDPTIKYTDINHGDFLNKYSIKGSAGFSKGLDEVVFVLGGQIRSAIHIDFSPDKSHVLSVETGVKAEFYSQEILLMADQKPTSAFYNLFIAFQFGKRW